MELTTLGEIISLQRGYDLTESQRRPGTIPVVGSAGVHGFHDTAKAKGPGVALGRSGASFGKVSYVRKDYWPHNTTIFVTDFKGNDPAFVRYLLESLDFSSLNSGSAQQSLNRNYVYTVQAPKFTLPAQRRIAGILSAYDDLIENSQRRIKILEEMARRLYREWFVHFRFPGHESCRFVESPLGEIPEGWEVRCIGDTFKTVLGGTPSRGRSDFWEDGTIPWINSGKVNELRIIDASELITPLALAKSAAKLMPKSTTLIAITGATLGQVSYLEIEAAANQSVVGIVDSSGLLQEWVYLTVKERIQGIVNHASGGAQQHINKEIVNDVEIALPPIELASDFRDLVAPLFRDLATLFLQVRNLRSTRDLLLPRLLSAQIDVEALPEPARSEV